MNEQSGNSGQLPPDAGSGGDAPIDVTDPWRGLYKPEALAARKPVGEPVAWLIDWPEEPGLGHYFAEEPTDQGRCRALYTAPPAPAALPAGLQDIIGSMLNYAGVADSCEITQGHAPVAIRNWAEMLKQLAPSAAVPVDERQHVAIVEAAKLAYGLLWMGTNLTGPDLAHRARVALRDALGKQACGDGITAARATHPQPAAPANSEKGMADKYQHWINFYHRGDGDYGDFLRRVVLPRYTSEQPAAASEDRL
ncbi:hypothetical protein ABFO19_09110 [Xanthomonas citri pv. glycines]|uniref:Uncharacterized protein n=1 Tax=Xanthomonas campestris pv. glycines TaxID=473421 RepID=A0AAX0I4S9_XANCG|nr:MULTISPECIES: hypothetical protein [Xanthomonas]AOY63433.1 hypothetical protein BHE84_15570 [Xanthomonas citri pv. glycines str. 8ra]EWC53145.1 hypothetical protein XAR_0585 [Xanthomonas citri pv. glycines str. 8ra]OEY98616.1 hypothetical protein BIY41_09615 [Xanthomonas citri pv. glycines]OOW99944.1 hypothetical protein Xgly_02905 [Xanthomonas citri pv. glycines]QDR44918.1 hypothetical protein FPK90_09575 [Xanthomonas citri pv. glycines]